jgi:hypothetical protein
MAGKNYIVRFTMTRESLSTPFTMEQYIDVGSSAWDIIEQFLSKHPECSVSQEVSVDGLTWEHIFSFPTDELREELLAAYSDHIYSNDNIREDFEESGVTFEWQKIEIDA